MATPDEVDVWVGLDVGKDDHFAWVLSDDGETDLFSRSVANDEEALRGLLEQAQGHGTPGLVIDQPGSIGQLVLVVAGQCGVPVAYVPGLVMRRAADLYPGEAKTDPIDARVLADTARTRRHQVHWLDVSDDLLGELRVLNGYDIDLAADQTRITNRCRDNLTATSPALERAVGSRLHQAGVRDLLTRFSTPTALKAAGRTKIRNAIKRRSPRLATKVTDAVTAALDAQSVTLPAEAATGRVISDLVVDLGRIIERRSELVAEIEEAFLAHPLGPVLNSLPGIGPRTGARILAEIGDGSRFASGAKLASYAGLAPVNRQSGSSLDASSKSRRGNHRLKNAMFLAAFASLSSPDSRAFYDRKRAEGKKHNAAIICLARRRCNVIIAMLTNDQHYELRTPKHLQDAA